MKTRELLMILSVLFLPVLALLLSSLSSAQSQNQSSDSQATAYIGITIQPPETQKPSNAKSNILIAIFTTIILFFRFVLPRIVM